MGISDLANGLGYIYMVAQDGTTILNVATNTVLGARWMRTSGAVNAPVGANRAAIATITVTGCASTGAITAITITGNNQVGDFITVATSTNSVLAAQIATAINAFTPAAGYNFTASVVGAVVTVYAPASAGATPNGQTITISATSGTITTTTTAFANGAGNQGAYDATIGYRFYLDAAYGLLLTPQVQPDPTSLANAIEITKYLSLRGMDGAVDNPTLTINTKQVTSFDRRSNRTTMYLDNDPAVGLLWFIDPTQCLEGDIVIVRGVSGGGGHFVIQDFSLTSGAGNIYTTNAASFTVSLGATYMTLIYSNDPVKGAVFFEVCRSGDNQIVPNVANLRAQLVAEPVQGVRTTVLTSGGGTVNLIPGTDKQWQVYTGSPTLTSSWTIQAAGSPLDGDEFWVQYLATPIPGVNTVTILGNTLSFDQTKTGGVLVYGKYDLTNTLWRTQIFLNQALVPLGEYETITVPVSFETTEQCGNAIFVNYVFEAVRVYAVITKPIAATDSANVVVTINGSSTLATLTFPASSVVNTEQDQPLSGVYTGTPSTIVSTTSKTTGGGKALLTYIIKRRA